MRLSTKLNIYLGVPNFSTEILPAQLAYLKSYFRTRAFNALMPLSLALAAALTGWLAMQALASSGPVATRWSLLAGLALLGWSNICFWYCRCAIARCGAGRCRHGKSEGSKGMD